MVIKCGSKTTHTHTQQTTLNQSTDMGNDVLNREGGIQKEERKDWTDREREIDRDIHRDGYVIRWM